MAMDIAMDRGKGIRSKPWALSACGRVGSSIGQGSAFLRNRPSKSSNPCRSKPAWLLRSRKSS